MSYSVIKGAGYILVHVPGMVMHHGTTQTTEKVVNPGSDYLKELPSHMRSYADCVAYPPNQTYIGNLPIEELAAIPEPWADKKVEKPERFGKFGEIMPEDEFILLMQACDVFDLVRLDKEFVAKTLPKLQKHPLMKQSILDLIKEGDDAADIKRTIEEEHAESLIFEDKTVGYVKRAHDVDVNLSAHVMFENLVSKASEVLSVLHLLNNAGIDAADVDYMIDCSEEACGDMNQRGGGNFAKAAAEIAGLTNATGSDTRGFCAGPAHAIVEAASLVKAGTFKNVVVAGGGCTAKLGMNGKDHVKKGLPILEDCLGGFAVLISENDGKSPEINTDIVGRHRVGTGSAPQAVIGSLVTDPLAEAGMTILDVDKYSPEMQNPDITKPAGAGDVPESNYKMIGALGVKLGQMERKDLPGFVKEHGLKGYAPTQGHIPSGVPYLGYARESIMAGETKNAMIIGKGSLFLGRMTNLFDGISFLVQANTKKNEQKAAASTKVPVIGIAAAGYELDPQNLVDAVEFAANKGCKAIVIDGEDCHAKMEAMLKSGEIDGAVTSHYPFPIGVSTVGRVITPALGKEMFIACTTGTSSTDRAEAMVKNAIYGIIAAKACGIEEPTVGILNSDDSRRCERALLKLKENGYPITFAESCRADGGHMMRGNDVLRGTPDVLACDPLTGNLMMKMFSSFNTGGNFEASGFGYGPGIGGNYGKLILIISRASGAPVIANAVQYASQLAQAGWLKISGDELRKAQQAGLNDVLEEMRSEGKNAFTKPASKVKAPAKETVTVDIHGVEVTDIDAAVESLWEKGIYAESGMGCTGPVVMVNEAKAEKASAILKEKGFIA